MKLAIMQPYLFPYIGYFQLICAVDKFVFYDDVNYIKQGWISRNQILLNGKTFMFIVPLDQPSPFKKINEILVNAKLFEGWRVKFFKTLDQVYRKAPFYKQTMDLLLEIFNIEKNPKIHDLAKRSITETANYLNIDTKLEYSSGIYRNSKLNGEKRVIDICLMENASQYINPIGGQVLYSQDVFEKKNIKLNFIKSNKIEYKQFNNEFVPWLSIIDVLMFNSVDEVKLFLNNYEVI